MIGTEGNTFLSLNSSDWNLSSYNFNLFLVLLLNVYKSNKSGNPNGQQTCLFALGKLKSLQLVNWWEIQAHSLFFMPLHHPALTSWIKMLRSDMVHSSTLGVGAMLLWGVLRAPHWVSGLLFNSTLLSPQSLAASLGHCSMFFHGLYHFSV